jgi:hypothetical protein
MTSLITVSQLLQPCIQNLLNPCAIFFTFQIPSFAILCRLRSFLPFLPFPLVLCSDPFLPSPPPSLSFVSVLGIRYILVRIRIRIPGSGSPDPYLWLMDPDTTPFFNDFKDVKKIFFSSYFFLITYPQVHHRQS